MQRIFCVNCSSELREDLGERLSDFNLLRGWNDLEMGDPSLRPLPRNRLLLTRSLKTVMLTNDFSFDKWEYNTEEIFEEILQVRKDRSRVEAPASETKIEPSSSSKVIQASL